eukprot:GEMP01028373.1.p1 GENE.GEMP01028373.1~~GEMP01028373.1.p1  ORF type:complete len:489 (+),score=124.79 GEMP01028373.1:269-1735(+)
MARELRVAMTGLVSEASMPLYVAAEPSIRAELPQSKRRAVGGTTTMMVPAKQFPVNGQPRSTGLRDPTRLDEKPEDFSARRRLQLRAAEHRQSPVIASIPVGDHFDVLQVKGSQAYVLYKGHIGWVSIESDVGVRTLRGRESGTTVADLRAIEQGESDGTAGGRDDKASMLMLQPDGKQDLSLRKHSRHGWDGVDVYDGHAGMADAPPRRKIEPPPSYEGRQLDPAAAFHEFLHRPNAAREAEVDLQKRLNEMLATRPSNSAARPSNSKLYKGNRQPEVTHTDPAALGDIPTGVEQHRHPQPALGSVCQSPEWRGVPGVVYSYGGPMEQMPRVEAAVAERGCIPVSVSYGLPHKSQGPPSKPGELGLPSQRPRRRDLLFETENIDRHLALTSLDDALRKGMACALFRALLARIGLVYGFRTLKEANMHYILHRQPLSPKVRERLYGARDASLRGASIYKTYLNALLSETEIMQRKLWDAEQQDICARY